MKLGKNKVRSQWLTLSALATCIIGNTALAAPGVIGTKPLIMDTIPVQPNIFFLVDDSGSMNWEDLLNEGTKFPADSQLGNSGLNFTPNNNDWLEKRSLCRGFNVMAYDPNVTYQPWAGVDADGNNYTNLTLTTARANPYNSTTTDISDHVYVTWTDGDNDGEYDGPGKTNVNSSSSTNDECDIANPVSVSSLTAAQQTNYANWYSYYRKREYVAKRALSQIIKDSTARVGLGSLHNHNSIRTLVADIDDISTPVDTTAQANKTALLDNLFNITSSNGTPLRNGLKGVGEYFAGNSAWGSSPILSHALGGQCQKNFAIVMSDGFWNGNSPSVGNTDEDGTGPWDGGSHADTISDTLADVAMKYYETDLKPDDTDTAYPDIVPTVAGVDENSEQHLVTYTVAFGVNGTLDANPADRTTSFNWPTPSSGDPTTIDDMRHAAWNGRGKFLSAGDPQQLINSLNAAIREINSLAGSSAAAALNTTSLQDDSRVYMASYDSQGWFGNLNAYKFTTTGQLEADPAWNANGADGALTEAGFDFMGRKILTYNSSSSSLVELKTEIDTVGSLATSQKADLLTGKPVAETDANYLEKVIRFMYGDHSNEVGRGGSDYFRNRGNHRLGDIVHSAPVHVGAPNAPYPDGFETDSYFAFKTKYSTGTDKRNGTIFVGSNDGMLHAFNAADGSEQFAYVPNLLFSTASDAGLHYLANPAYEHKYYTDLTPTVTDVFVNDDWRTMLVAGLRGGGKGIYALDVTTEGTPVYKFEYTHVDMGYTFSEIQIAKMNNGKWAAIFGNGYNNTGDGTAKLFIVYLDGTTPLIIPTGRGSITNGDCADAGSDCNGLSTPAIADLNGDGKIDRIYAGDVQGNMWSFNVSAGATWESAYGSNTPLFTACRSTTSPCPAADRQPITSKPALARHPTQRGDATFTNIMVMFGTGQFLTTNDVTDASAQAVYGIWDRGDSGLLASDLIEQTLSETTSASGHTIRKVTDLSVNYVTDSSTTDHGWFFDLPVSKERVVVNPVAYGSMLFINSMIPESPQVCSAKDGTGWLMAVDIANGGQPSFQPIDVNNDNLFTDLDAEADNAAAFAIGTQIDGIPTESRFVSDKRITVDSEKDVNIQSVQGVPPGDPARMSWTVL
ncbi:pilus assembly protein [Kaarinaea lacus]